MNLAREHGQRDIEGLGLRLIAEIAAHRDPPSAIESEDYYCQAVSLAADLGMQSLVAHCYLGLGTLSRRTGKREPAQEHLAATTTMYREMDLRFYLELAEVGERLRSVIDDHASWKAAVPLP